MLFTNIHLFLQFETFDIVFFSYLKLALKINKKTVKNADLWTVFII